jgi:peptidyl-prolyl cis-trans isomerase SurA
MRATSCLLLLGLLLATSACQSASTPASDDEIWAEVNGHPIYRSQVERYYERETRALPEPPTSAEEQAHKLNILSAMIEEEILWQAAVQAGIQATDADVEARLQQMRADLTSGEFEQQLHTEGTSTAELKAQLRRDIAVGKLFERTLQQGVQVTDAEVEQYYQQYQVHFRTIETQFHVAHILVTPRRDLEIRNLRNDDAANEDQARRKVQQLNERLRANEDFAELARAYSEDPATALAGGDLGFFPESALQNSHPALRSAVERLEEGGVAGPIRTQDGYELVKLLERVPPGQRELSDPTVQESIRNTLRGQKRQLLELAYAERLRNRARVANYFAREILESNRVAP